MEFLAVVRGEERRFRVQENLDGSPCADCSGYATDKVVVLARDGSGEDLWTTECAQHAGEEIDRLASEWRAHRASPLQALACMERQARLDVPAVELIEELATRRRAALMEFSPTDPPSAHERGERDCTPRVCVVAVWALGEGELVRWPRQDRSEAQRPRELSATRSAYELKCAACAQRGPWSKTRWIPYEGTTPPFCDACDKVAEGWSCRVRTTAEEHAAFRAARDLRMTRLAAMQDEQMRVTLDERLDELVEAQMADHRYAHGLERWSSTAGRHMVNRAAHERVAARTREWLEHFVARWSTQGRGTSAQRL